MDHETLKYLELLSKSQESLNARVGTLSIILLALVKSHPDVSVFEKSLNNLINYIESENDGDAFVAEIIAGVKLFSSDVSKE